MLNQNEESCFNKHLSVNTAVEYAITIILKEKPGITGVSYYKLNFISYYHKWFDTSASNVLLSNFIYASNLMFFFKYL